jgi:hypothetical protein
MMEDDDIIIDHAMASNRRDLNTSVDGDIDMVNKLNFENIPLGRNDIHRLCLLRHERQLLP